ncbi:NAD-dependent epimerase/dehydratase family protein [Caldithrix abyssi]|nr:NAD-dependent epimerase/dehydratase family protein [Caldithrix abyssi]
MKTKNILVTGSAGFIGSVVAKRLISEGYQVVTIDNLSTGFEENIPDGVIFIRGDCADDKIINQLEKYDFDAIFHIAGQSSGEISFENPEYDLKTNALSTLLLLKYAHKKNVKKFIYASTMSVYGDQPDKPINEDAITLPKSFYAVGKLASENYLKIFSGLGINTISLRLFNCYGPGQNLKNLKQGMISIYLAQALKNKHLLVKGDSNRFRDFVYIDDVVDSFYKVYNTKMSGYHYYNICTGNRTTVYDLISMLKKQLPFDFTLEFSSSTPGDQFGIYGNNIKIKNEIGWVPQTELSYGLNNMINWIMKNNE